MCKEAMTIICEEQGKTKFLRIGTEEIHTFRISDIIHIELWPPEKLSTTLIRSWHQVSISLYKGRRLDFRYNTKEDAQSVYSQIEEQLKATFNIVEIKAELRKE